MFTSALESSSDLANLLSFWATLRVDPAAMRGRSGPPYFAVLRRRTSISDGRGAVAIGVGDEPIEAKGLALGVSGGASESRATASVGIPVPPDMMCFWKARWAMSSPNSFARSFHSDRFWLGHTIGAMIFLPFKQMQIG